MNCPLPIQVMPYSQDSTVPTVVNGVVNTIVLALAAKTTLIALDALGISVATAAITTIIVFSVGSVIFAAIALYTFYRFCECLAEFCNEITSCFHTAVHNALKADQIF